MAGFARLRDRVAGHNKPDAEQGITGHDVLSRVRRYIAEETAGLIAKLDAIPEGDGTMLDNTLLVFTSDSANRQHTSGENWPFVLLGKLGGRLRTGRFLGYPMRERGTPGEWDHHGGDTGGNPTINALYCTLLHAVGAPRDQFNLPAGLAEADGFGPLAELIV